MTCRTSGTTGITTEHRWIERGRGDPSSFRPLEYSTKLFFCLEVFFTYIYYFLINFDNSDFDESCFFE